MAIPILVLYYDCYRPFNFLYLPLSYLYIP
jgi:hypothetical protein